MLIKENPARRLQNFIGKCADYENKGATLSLILGQLLKPDVYLGLLGLNRLIDDYETSVMQSLIKESLLEPVSPLRYVFGSIDRMALTWTDVTRRYLNEGIITVIRLAADSIEKEVDAIEYDPELPQALVEQLKSVLSKVQTRIEQLSNEPKYEKEFKFWARFRYTISTLIKDLKIYEVVGPRILFDTEDIVASKLIVHRDEFKSASIAGDVENILDNIKSKLVVPTGRFIFRALAEKAVQDPEEALRFLGGGN